MRDAYLINFWVNFQELASQANLPLDLNEFVKWIRSKLPAKWPLNETKGGTPYQPQRNRNAAMLKMPLLVEERR